MVLVHKQALELAVALAETIASIGSSSMSSGVSLLSYDMPLLLVTQLHLLKFLVERM